MSRFGGGRGQIFLDEVECEGSENYLVNCPNDGVGIHDCRHFEDAGVICRGKKWVDKNNTVTECYHGVG